MNAYVWGAWTGGFIGVLLVPYVMLRISGLKPRKTWLRVVAGAWGALSAYGMASGGNYNYGAIVAGVVAVVWAYVQNENAVKAELLTFPEER